MFFNILEHFLYQFSIVGFVVITRTVLSGIFFVFGDLKVTCMMID